jgi:tripeptidyl-peptidase-2
MDVTITDIREDESDVSSRNIIVHSLQMLPHAAYRDAEVRKNYGFSPNETKIVSIPLHGGITCELVCARSWNTLGPTKINVSVRFRGVCPTPNSIQLSAGGEGSCVRLLSELRTENINPTAKLTKWRTPLRPKPDGGFIVSPLPDNRDVIPFTNKQIFQAILTFEFTQETSGSITPIAPFLQGYLYESAFESQMMLIFDGNKKYLGVADAWPDEVRVPKGNITIRLQVRHDDISKLEKLKNLVIWIERKLEKDIFLSIYTSRYNLMLGGESFKKRPLYKGASCSVFLSGPPNSRLPKEYKSGDTLTGFVTFEAGESSLPGEGKRPGGFPLSYILASKPPNNKDTNTSDDIDERSPQEKLDEVVRDTKVDFLGKLTAKDKKDGKFMELYEPMLQQYQKHIPLLLEGLKYHDDEETRKNHLGKVVEAADMVIAAISHEEIALHFGKNQDKDDPKAVKERKEMTKTRNILSEAWARKARALADMDKGEEFESAFIELKKWIFEKEERYSVVMLERDRRAGRYGVMLKSLNALIGKEVKGAISPLSKADLLTMRAEVLEVLGYKELVEYDKARRVIDSPKSYRLF